MVVVVVMGVCGCGKTTVGKAFSEQLGWPFRDADEFHSEANKRKMSSSIPLTDLDRIPWLTAIHQYIKSMQDKGQSAVVTCSALKRCYRDILRSGDTSTVPDARAHSDTTSSPSSVSSSSSPSSSGVLFVLLKGSKAVLEARLAGRQGHFMPPDLLTSQLAILEEPDKDENSLVVDIDAALSEIVAAIVEKVQHSQY